MKRKQTISNAWHILCDASKQSRGAKRLLVVVIMLIILAAITVTITTTTNGLLYTIF